MFQHCSCDERPQWVVGSTGGRNTLVEHFSWRLIHQGFSGSLVELSRECAELGLAVEG